MDRPAVPDEAEDRRFERFGARISRIGISDGERFVAEIYNISAGGLLLSTDQHFAIGQYINIDLPEAGPRKAIVVWRDEAFHGCEFAEPLQQSVVSAVRLASLPDAEAQEPKSIEPETFSERLRWARQRAMLTQAELAGKIGVSAPALSNWETGNASPTPSHLRALLQVLPQLRDIDLATTRMSGRTPKRAPLDQLREALEAVLLPNQRVSGIDLTIHIHVDESHCQETGR